MKSNTFNVSLLAVGVATVMGISTSAMAEIKAAEGSVTIINIAKATYSVDGTPQNAVESNPVTVSVSESGSFSLIAQNVDDKAGDDLNTGIEVVPTGVAQFVHRLENLGNLTDTYTMALTNKTGDTKDFDLATTKVTYVVYKDGGGIVKTLTDITVDAFAATPISLEKDEYAIITVNGKTTGNIGGDTQNLTLTAKSTYLAGKGSPEAATATNTDESTTKLPVFSIVKSVSQTLDINKTDATAEYTITVKNDKTATYSADAVGIKIADNLPEGLKLVAASLTTDSITTTGLATKGKISQNNKGFGSGATIDGFEITGVNLPVGETITIKFKVQRDTDETLAKSTINHVQVEAPLGGGSNVTIIDSTDGSTKGGENTSTYYPASADNENENGAAPTTPGGDSTQPLTSNQRELTLTGPTTKEIPNTSTATTQATHQTVITNTGRETEGANAGELKFKIEDGGTNANVEPAKTGNITLAYDKDGDPATTTDITTKTLPYNASGEYDINAAFPTGIASKSTVTVSYNVVSTAAETGTSETTKITLIPGGTDKPVAPAAVIDTTNVKGLSLVKSQALDATCSGTVADSAFSSSTTALDAQPGQCVVYKIVATNTFASLGITSLVISDLLSNFSAGATVQSIAKTATTGSGNTVTVEANNNNTTINTTVNPLAATNTATLRFSVKIKP